MGRHGRITQRDRDRFAIEAGLGDSVRRAFDTAELQGCSCDARVNVITRRVQRKVMPVAIELVHDAGCRHDPEREISVDALELFALVDEAIDQGHVEP